MVESGNGNGKGNTFAPKNTIAKHFWHEKLWKTTIKFSRLCAEIFVGAASAGGDGVWGAVRFSVWVAAGCMFAIFSHFAYKVD